MSQARAIKYITTLLGIAGALLAFLLVQSAFSQTTAREEFDKATKEFAETIKEVKKLETELDSYTNRINALKGAGAPSRRSTEMNDLQARSKSITDSLSTLQNRAERIKALAKKAALAYLGELEQRATKNPEAGEMQRLKSERERVKNWLQQNVRVEARAFLLSPPVAESDDMDTLKEKADLLKDREEQVKNYISQIRARINEVSQRQKLWRERDFFMREESIFDEQVYFARPESQALNKPASEQKTGLSAPTASKDSSSTSSQSDASQQKSGEATEESPQPGEESNPPASADENPGFFVRSYRPPTPEADAPPPQTDGTEGGATTSPSESSPTSTEPAVVGDTNPPPAESSAITSDSAPFLPAHPLNVEIPNELPSAALYTSTDLGYLKNELKRWEKVADEIEKQQKIFDKKIKEFKETDKR
ncbi:MAG: hypothetical protein Kow0090_19460 [Myxococcota bacterium]